MPIRATQIAFVMCTSNEGFEDLEPWKVYRTLVDRKAEKLGCLRVVDESGEDYLYPAGRFVKVELPKEVRARLAVATA